VKRFSRTYPLKFRKPFERGRESHLANQNIEGNTFENEQEIGSKSGFDKGPFCVTRIKLAVHPTFLINKRCILTRALLVH
jgi:hypothetical protein